MARGLTNWGVVMWFERNLTWLFLLLSVKLIAWDINLIALLFTITSIINELTLYLYVDNWFLSRHKRLKITYLVILPFHIYIPMLTLS